MPFSWILWKYFLNCGSSLFSDDPSLIQFYEMTKCNFPDCCLLSLMPLWACDYYKRSHFLYVQFRFVLFLIVFWIFDTRKNTYKAGLLKSKKGRWEGKQKGQSISRLSPRLWSNMLFMWPHITICYCWQILELLTHPHFLKSENQLWGSTTEPELQMVQLALTSDETLWSSRWAIHHCLGHHGKRCSSL